jgi:AcrR family transcriptional regulator
MPPDINDNSIQMQIIHAARYLFQAQGLHKVTMDDVAREIGKGRSSLYYYYKNKEELIEAAVVAEMQEILAGMSTAINAVDTFEDKIRAYCTARLKISLNKRAFSSMLDNVTTADEFKHYKSVRNTIYARFQKMEAPLVKEILQSGISNGFLRDMDANEQNTIVFIILSTTLGLKKEMMINKRISDAAEPVITMLISLIADRFKR